MKQFLKWVLTTISILYLILLVGNRQVAGFLYGGNSYLKHSLSSGNVEVPIQRTIAWKTRSAFADSVYRLWANKPIKEEELDEKGTVPQILLAKMMLNRDISEVNNTILKFKVWGISGSTWALNKKGDYDFTISTLTTILWLFGDKKEILYPKSKEYLLNTLLSEDGNSFRYAVPHTLGLLKETENHVLMTEGSRYLKNRWLMQHGNSDTHYNNIENGMENKLLAFLDEMRINGLYEFNSLPYTGYTITALLNLEAFGSDAIRAKAGEVLNYMNWCYALGSYQLKHYPPMRRRYEKAGIQKLTTDYHSAFMKAWLSYSPVEKYDTDIRHAEVHALMGSCIPYQPADEVIKTIFGKGNGYFVKLGHGKNACPEIYSAGKHFLLSAGGINRGEQSLIVTRPIILFLNDTASVLSNAFHISGPGNDYMQWNNTGVFQNFACAAGPVCVPSGLIPLQKQNNWSVYLMADSVSVAVYSTERLGIMAIAEQQNPKTFLEDIIRLNSDCAQLGHRFTMPCGSEIEYDLSSPKDKWVIKLVDRHPLDRNYDKWPLIQGNFQKSN
jgi:hypothetical protein